MTQKPLPQDQLEITLSFLNYHGVLFIRETSSTEDLNREDL
ncbi:MAG: hypothetical protein ACFE95_05055 [Candidatus Hodarchaeota archaeon]